MLESGSLSRSLGRLVNEVPVGQSFGGHNAPERVHKNVRVTPVIVSPLQLFEVAVDMLGADFMERPDDRPLEQRPDALDAVGVHVPYNPLLGGVVGRFVARVVVGDTKVRLQFIGVDGISVVTDCLVDKLMERVMPDVRNALEADLAASLNGASNVDLVSSTGLAALPADHRLIHLHDAEQRRSDQGVVAHRLADTVAEVPRCPVGTNAEHFLHLVRADALLRYTHQVDGEEPLPQRQVGVVHDRLSRHAELVAA